MTSRNYTREEMWAQQQISALDVDYDFWNRQLDSIIQMSRISSSCIFTVDVFKGIYDFASENFSDDFGYNKSLIKTIRENGDMLEDRIHPDDRDKLIDMQVRHSQFIYSLPFEKRNDFRQIFQFRMLNVRQQYINVTSRQQVIMKDKKGKAWIVMGIMDVSPDQAKSERIKCSVVNMKTGEIFNPLILSSPEIQLTAREKEILILIRQGLLSKEIADKLNVSIFTVNNHRKSILAKLKADNAIEAINYADNTGILN